jgi:predicted AAA+ superfamily ATPase
MRYVRRELEGPVGKAAKSFPATVLTGPRRAGKTWLLRHLFPRATYVLLEDPDVVARLRADPQGFLDAVKTPAILDEAQNVPEVFAFVRSRIDRQPRRVGQWVLTGSQEAPLMHGVSESMAGRAAVLQLYPMSSRESARVNLLRGGYPEVVARPGSAQLWFSSYVQTYLERDVRAVTSVRDLVTFRRFLALLASRHGQVLNKTDLAAPLGVSVPTIAQWLSVLETTAQILIVPPFYENFGKRLIKSPKVYLVDSGLAGHLLGIASEAELARSPFAGVLFEGFIAAEIVKAQVNRGRRRELYYFRDEQGLEVDFVIPGRGNSLRLVECKAGRTVVPAMATPMQRLAEAARKRRANGAFVEMILVHQPPRAAGPVRAVAPGVQAVPWREFVADLGSRRESARRSTGDLRDAHASMRRKPRSSTSARWPG